MSSPNVQTTSDASGGALYTNPVVLDTWVSPFSVSLNVAVTGTVNYTVQYTYDVISQSWDATTANWLSLSSMATKTAASEGSLSAPVTAVRLTQASGTGSCTFTVIQAGVGR